MSGRRAVRAIAPAKINLWLDVLGRRGDGYHEVDTWILALDHTDVLEARASPRPGVTLALSGEHASADVPRGATNLVARAAASVLEAGRARGRLGASAGVELALEKRIPSRAGLGGGSSDAAAAWLATCAVLDVALPAEVARDALSALGADCAFFVGARGTGSARCQGRGERVSPAAAPVPTWFVAVVTPDVECPTAAVYAALDTIGGGRPPLTHLPVAWHEMTATSVRPFLFNRLEEAAIARFSELALWRTLLDRSGAEHWRLSGSGSSFFGLYDGAAEADGALERLRGPLGAERLACRAAWTARPAGCGASLVELG